MAENGKINIRYAFDYTGLQQGTGKASRILSQTKEQGVREAGELEKAFTKLGAVIASTFAASKIKDFAMQVAKIRGEYQQLEVAFSTMLGNKKQADTLMVQLTKTAATTPFQMNDIANSAKQLLAYGVAAEDVNKTLVRLGDIAAGLSIPINDLAYLYGTTMVQGRLYTQDLNQFLNRGIPLTKELASQFGVQEGKVKELVEKGRVGFPQIEKAIISMTSAGGKFGGLMEAQSKTISGQISNIEDGIEQMFNKIGSSSEGVISSTLRGVSYIVEHWRTLANIIASVAAAYGTYKAVLLVVMAAQKIAAAVQTYNNRLLREVVLQKQAAAAASIKLSNAEAVTAARTAMLSRAFNTLKTAIMTNPIGIVAGILATLAGCIMMATTKTDEAAIAAEKEAERLKELMDVEKSAAKHAESLAQARESERQSLESMRSELELNIQKLKNFKGTKEEEKKLVQKMNTAYGETIGYFKSVSKWYHALVSDSEAYCRQMIVESRTRKLADQVAELQQEKHDLLYDENGKARKYSTARQEIMGANQVPTSGGAVYYQYYGTGRYSDSDYDKAVKAIKDRTDRIAALEKQMKEAADEAAGITYSVTGAKKDPFAAGLDKDKDKKRIAEQIADRKQKLKEYAQGVIDAVDEANMAIEQKQIELMNEGREKELRQLDFNYRKLRAENAARAREMMEALAKARLNAWRNTNPKATKEQQNEYYNSLLDPGSATRLTEKDLTAGQQATLAAYAQLAEQFRKQGLDNMKQADQQALNEYLAQYGTLQAKRKAINRTYEQQYSNASTAGEALIIRKQWDEALANLDVDSLKKSIGWDEVFENLSKKSGASLKDIKAKLEDFIATNKKLSPEAVKEIKRAIEQIGDTLDERDPWQAMISDFGDLMTATKNVHKAQEAYNQALKTGTAEQQAAALSTLRAAQDTKQTALVNANKSLKGTTAQTKQWLDLANAVADCFTSFGVELPAELTGFLAGLGNTVSALDSIDLTKPMSIITGAVKAIGGLGSGIASLFNHDSRRQKNIEKLQDQVDSLERAYAKLGNAIDEAYSTDAAALIEQQNTLLLQQRALIQQQIAEEEAKKSTDDDKVEQWKQKLEDIDQAIADNKKTAVDAIIGEDISSSIDSFADALADAWGNSAKAARSAKEYAKDMMKQMVIEAMKTDLTAPIQRLRQMMSESLNDGIVTDAEQEGMEAFAKQLAEDIQQRYQWASDILGASANAQSGADNGGFATASQDSITELNGRFAAMHTSLEMTRQTAGALQIDTAAMREQLAQQNRMADESLSLQATAISHLEAISKNTKQLYEINDRLGKIEKNTQNL